MLSNNASHQLKYVDDRNCGVLKTGCDIYQIKKRFIGIIFFMSVLRLTRIKLNWQKKKIISFTTNATSLDLFSAVRASLSDESLLNAAQRKLDKF